MGCRPRPRDGPRSAVGNAPICPVGASQPRSTLGPTGTTTQSSRRPSAWLVTAITPVPRLGDDPPSNEVSRSPLTCCIRRRRTAIGGATEQRAIPSTNTRGAKRVGTAPPHYGVRGRRTAAAVPTSPDVGTDSRCSEPDRHQQTVTILGPVRSHDPAELMFASAAASDSPGQPWRPCQAAPAGRTEDRVGLLLPGAQASETGEVSYRLMPSGHTICTGTRR